MDDTRESGGYVRTKGLGSLVVKSLTNTIKSARMLLEIDEIVSGFEPTGAPASVE